MSKGKTNACPLPAWYEADTETEEWIGETMRVPSPPPVHQMIVQNILCKLREIIGDTYFLLQAPCDLQLSENEFRKPDLMLIHQDNASGIRGHAVVEPPSLVIEVLSKTSHALDCNVKHRHYAQFGIPEYWIIDGEKQELMQFILVPNKTAYIQTKLYTKNDTLISDILTRASFKVKEAFANL